MSQLALERDPLVQGRVVLALAARGLRLQLRKAQFLLPAFLLPLVLLAVIASGTSAAKQLPGFPSTGAYVGFVVCGTLMQGTLLAGMTAGIALAGDIEGGFFDRLLTAPVHRASLVLGRVLASCVLGAIQGLVFLSVAFVAGARYEGGVWGVLVTLALAGLSAGGAAGLTSAIALRTGSLALLQNLFPIIFVLLFTAPAFFPRDLLSPALKAVARFNPLTYVVEGMRGALHAQASLGDPLAGFGAAGGLVVGTTLLAMFAMRSRMRAL